MPFVESLPYIPQRIVSLVPSQTELLFDLGLGERVVGVTKFCTHPAEQTQRITKVGGTKQFRFPAIDQLQPDLILGNKEENYQEGIEQLATRYPVWISDIFNLSDALGMISQVGSLTGKSTQAMELAKKIDEGFRSLKPLTPQPKVAYLIWKKPYMAACGLTFIHDMLIRCGFLNVFGHLSRYPEVTVSSLANTRVGYVFLSSEPYPFKEKDLQELQIALPASRIVLVDGEMFSWYGSRLLQSVSYFQSLAGQLAG
jgi:ABC-type Fe3+-hydroxamate transport system substrate-binding protein